MTTSRILAWYQNPKKHLILAQFSNSPWTGAISDKAHLLVENAIKALMQLNGLDRETAERAIRDIMGGT
jgi:hypothetical protein